MKEGAIDTKIEQRVRENEAKLNPKIGAMIEILRENMNSFFKPIFIVYLLYVR